MRRASPSPGLVLASTLALSACGGGGGGPTSTPAAVSVTFTAGALDVDEDGGPASVGVRLSTSSGPLASEVRVTVGDLSSGSATSGLDYGALAPQVVTFPVGSASGAVASVVLAPVDDGLVEGAPETVVLGLSAPVGAALGSHPSVTLRLLDAQSATIQLVNAATASVGEGNVSHVVTAQLSLTPGATLAVDVSARLRDAASGTATAGADYVAFATQTLAFPAGTSSGATLDASLDVLDDALLEGDESVRLELFQPDGATLGAQTQHQLLILDDDVGVDPFLYASEGPGGTEVPLAHDAQLDLGSQSVGAGPNAGTLVRVANIGGGSFGLAAPELSGSHPKDFAVEIESSALRPPPAPGAAGFRLAPDAACPLVPVAAAPLARAPRAVAFALDPARLAALAASTRVTLQGFRVPGLGEVALDLRRVPPPFAPDALLVVDGRVVPGGPRAALGDLSMWSGSVLGLDGSRVFLAFTAQGSRGWVELEGSDDRLLHLVSEGAPASGAPVVSRLLEDHELAALGLAPSGALCGGARVPPGSAGLPTTPPEPAGPGGEALTVADCAVAVETDYQLFQKFGDVGATTTYVTQLFAAVSDRYLVDVQATLSIAYLGIYSSPADPWTSQDSGGNAGDLLDEFRAAWNSSGWPVAADLAHFVSGASLGGGVAYVDVLCNQSFGYGVSGNISGAINWGAWTGQPTGLSWDFVVVAHELGHNFGTNHTHAYCPPLDRCYSNCNGTTACSQGTIMSYCHTCAGGMNNIKLEFHPVVADVMRDAINESCLGLSALAGGEYVQYLVRFNPLGGTGTRNANLDFVHTAANQPTPFRVRLTGSATN